MRAQRGRGLSRAAGSVRRVTGVIARVTAVRVLAASGIALAGLAPAAMVAAPVPADASVQTVPAAGVRAAGVPSVVLCEGWVNCTKGGYPSYGYQVHAATAYWRMYPGNDCTNYTAYVESTVYGVAPPGYLLGNAGQWPASAAAHGVVVNNTPSVGAVAEWDGGTVGMGSLGHVGVVEQVGPKNSYIVVSQQGLIGTDGYQWTQINAGYPATQWQEWPSHFIHFPLPHRALLGYFSASTGTVALRYSQAPGPANRSFGIRLPGAVPLVGHWGTARQDRVGYYDPATGTFHLPPAGAGPSAPIAFGPPGMIPLAGDWQGTGTDGIGYYDPGTGHFYLRNTPTAGSPDESFAFGPPGMIPVVGDWTGGPADDVGYYNPATGAFTLRNGAAANPVYRTFRFGPPGMIPLTGNWAGGPIDGIGYYDPATGKFHLRYQPTGGWANAIVPAAAGITPLTGDWYW
jgi:surface antigen